MPTYEEARVEAGQYMEQKNYAACETLCDQLLGITLKDSWVLAMLGSLHSMHQRHGHAILFFQRAVSEKPDFHEAWNGLGVALRGVGHEEAARECYLKAIELSPVPSYYANLGGSYVNSGEPEKGIEYSRKCIELEPDNKVAWSNLSLALLETGNWDEGFSAYLRRKQLEQFTSRDYGCPAWDGKPTELLVVHGEQGLGDEIMFMTCVEDLLKVQKDVVLEVSPRLVKLVQNSFPDTKVYASPEEVLEKHVPTAQTAIGDLGYWFRRNGKFPGTPYLKPVTAIREPGDRPRIGISWYGGSRKTHSYARNFPIKWWKPLLELNAEFISLQYGPYGKSESEQLGIAHEQAEIDDLDALAARIAGCDLVVTVCNTTVHMAGALGVPCFVFVPHRAAWRYGVKGEEMAWYKSVKLYRQAQDQPWPEVVERVTGDVKKLIEAGE